MNGWIGAGCLALALAATAALAAPAEPDAPARLPGEVVGVVGSGDQLSLRLRRDEGGEATLKIGDEYRDGWRLQALTADTATLAKGGETRRVGLNPAGALAPEAQDGPRPVMARLMSAEEAARIEAAGLDPAELASLSFAQADFRVLQVTNRMRSLEAARISLQRQSALREQGFGTQQAYDAAVAGVAFQEAELARTRAGLPPPPRPPAQAPAVPGAPGQFLPSIGPGGGGGGGGPAQP